MDSELNVATSSPCEFDGIFVLVNKQTKTFVTVGNKYLSLRDLHEEIYEYHNT